MPIASTVLGVNLDVMGAFRSAPWFRLSYSIFRTDRFSYDWGSVFMEVFVSKARSVLKYLNTWKDFFNIVPAGR
jgi:hypothetical protein